MTFFFVEIHAIDLSYCYMVWMVYDVNQVMLIVLMVEILMDIYLVFDVLVMMEVDVDVEVDDNMMMMYD